MARWALAGSVVLHGALVGLVAAMPVREAPVRRVEPVEITLAQPEPQPQPEPEPEAGSRKPEPEAGSRRPEAETGVRIRKPVAEPETAVAVPTRWASLRATSVPRVEAIIPEDPPPPLAALDLSVPPPAVEPRRVTGDWEPEDDGSFRVDRPGFAARVAPDGHVDFRDKHIEAKIDLPNPGELKRALVRDVTRWYQDPYEYTREMGRRGKGIDDNMPGRPVYYERDLDPNAPPTEKPTGVVYVPIFAIRFDATDALMRAAGQDPYRAAKRNFLGETEDVRAGMRARHQKRVMDDALADLPGRLARLWRRSDLSEVERRRLLFLLWDECAEDATGTRARRLIEDFAREHVTYPTDELAGLNRSRTSRDPFQP